MKKTKFKSAVLVALAALVTPALASAQCIAYTNPARRLVCEAGGIVQSLTGIVAALAVLVFFWGLVKYIWSAGSDGKADGRKIMINGAIALFVMFSIFGIIWFIRDAFEVGSNTTITPPSIRLPNSSGGTD